MDIIKDRLIYLLRENMKIKDLRDQIDFYTENEECNSLVEDTKAVMRTISDETEFNKLPLKLQLAIATILICRDNAVFIEPEAHLEDIINKLDSGNVSAISSSIFVLLKNHKIGKEE